MRKYGVRGIVALLSAVSVLTVHSCKIDFNPYSEKRTNKYSLFGFECGGYKFNQRSESSLYGARTIMVWNTVTRNDSPHIILCVETTKKKRIGKETGVPCIDTLLNNIGNEWVSTDLTVWLDIPYEQAKSGTIIESNNPYNEVRTEEFVWGVDESGFADNRVIYNWYPITSCKVTITKVTSDAIEGTFTAGFTIGCACEPETVLVENGVFRLVDDEYDGRRNPKYTYDVWQSSEIRKSSDPAVFWGDQSQSVK